MSGQLMSRNRGQIRFVLRKVDRAFVDEDIAGANRNAFGA